MMRRALLMCTALAGVVAMLDSRAETAPGTYTMISVRDNVRVDQWTGSGKAKTANGKFNWSVQKLTLHGGKQEGVDLIVIDNGKLQIRIVPTRGLNILDVKMGDLKLGWDSPVKQIVHPQHIRLESRGGLGWLEGFNEWMARCGLEFAGHPGKDEFINNTGDKASMDLTLHGKISNIPAAEVQVIIDPQPPHRIRVRGIVDEQSFYGPKLQLTAEVSTEPGSDTFRIEDSVKNYGAFEQEFQLIYHANFGAPILEKNARVIAATKRVSPMNEHAGKGVENFSVYAEPTRGFIEQVYLIEPYANDAGNTAVMLQNAAGDKAASMTFSTKQLPYLTIWKNTAAVEDGYVTGLEPATGFPFNRRVERLFGRVPKLGAGETRSFAIDVGLHAGKDAVASKAAQIEQIRGGRPTQVETQPPTPPAAK
jgi:hypothetical protein